MRSDSPTIGAGCYTDEDVGSAGAAGSGEENIKVFSALTISENTHKACGKRHTIGRHDGTKRMGKTANLFPGVSQEWPPKLA